MNKKLITILLILTVLFAASCDTISTTSPLTEEGVTEPSSTFTAATSDETTLPENSTETESTTDTLEEKSTQTEIPATTESVPDPMKDQMIFPDSDEALIMWEDLVPLSLEELALARNDFFAREGYVFQKQKYIDHYGSLAWYEPDEAFSYDRFSEVQQANILLIQVAEARAGNGLLLIPSGTMLDFDQDGVLEELTYVMPNEADITVTLHDTDGDRVWIPDSCYPYNRAYIGDILNDDGMLDLFVDETGASDDYRCSIAGLTPDGFLDRGRIWGDCDDIILAGDGTLTSVGRMDILMTWFATVKYVLEGDGSMLYEPLPEYFFGDFQCTTLVDVPMRSAPDLSMAADMLIPAGTAVTLVSSDDIRWVKIRWGSDEGWYCYSCFVTDTGTMLKEVQIFDGLVIAD